MAELLLYFSVSIKEVRANSKASIVAQETSIVAQEKVT